MGLRANQSAQTDESFNVDDFSFESLDIADGQTSDVSMDALKEMGIVSKDEGSSKGKVDQSKQTSEEIETPSKEASLDDILKELSKGNPKQFDQEIEDKLTNDKDEKEEKESDQPEKESKEEKEPLESIVYKGQEKKLSKSELRELAQKGFDYTQKTQELSKRNLEVEEKIKGLEEKEKELYSKFENEKGNFTKDINEKKQWDFVLNALQKQNPDLYDEIKSFSEELMVNFQNPLVQGLIEKVNSLESREVQKGDQEIARQYYSEMNDLKSTLFPTLEKLGIKVDENKVKDAWIKGAENVKAATYSIYGDQIRKLQESKLKLNMTKKKAALQKTPTAGNIKSTRSVKDPTPKRSSYHDITRKIMGY